MDCSLCGGRLRDGLPCAPFVMWKGHPVGECCYDRLLGSLEPESLTGDKSMTYGFEGVFRDPDGGRYHISQEVTTGPGNMGYARVLKVRRL